ncbi:MAG TPA: PIN domain-containing protein [Stellaceae bacterium]|nr:PIN domain-containing protein [Stellaceae bacterium]
MILAGNAGSLLDTGPLVAYLYSRDAYHDWAVEQFKAFDPPFVTCEPVITEACFLLARNRLSPANVLALMECGVLRVDLQLAKEAAALRRSMTRYADVPMSLADACLVRLAEITRLPLCTLDADFEIYRTRNGRALDLIMPPSRRAFHES